MPTPKSISQEIIDRILKGHSLEELIQRLGPVSPREKPLPPRIPRAGSWTQEDQEKRVQVLAGQGISFSYLTGRKNVEDPSIFQGNIENYIGLAKVPVGVIGPLRINGIYAKGDFYVPLATTEGAMVASHQRGAQLISLCGGARVMCLTERVSRAPGFKFENLVEAGQFLIWSTDQFEAFREVAQRTTRHGQLEDVRATLHGNEVFLVFEYTTGDASGQNIVTLATDAVCQYILAHTPVKPRFWVIESNLSGDKKATTMSYLFVRGKKVTAEVVIPRDLCQKILHATPETIMEYYKLSIIGSIQTGSIGAQGHYANALAAMFIACGQDAACVSEAAVGITRLDVVDPGDLYASVSLPNLIVGTIGGGTGLPTQQECLEMLGCRGEGSAKKFAEICAACVLGGEISIMGAIAAGEFAQAHQKFGRKRTPAGA
jgi:hydroxymethylglutaryl-CoA reductase (NADPH)